MYITIYVLGSCIEFIITKTIKIEFTNECTGIDGAIAVGFILEVIIQNKLVRREFNKKKKLNIFV